MAEDSGQNQDKKAELERGVEDSRQKLALLLQQLKMARVQMLIASIVAVVVILIYIYGVYGKGKDHYQQNFTEARVREVWALRSEPLRDKVEKIGRQAYEDILPIYRKTLQDKLEEIRPKAEKNAREVLMELEAQVKSDLDNILSASLNRLTESLKEKLDSDFDFVTDRTAEETFSQFTETMKAQIPKLRDQVDKAVTEEGADIAEMLNKFEVGELVQLDKQDLERAWVITLLEYAAYEFRVAGTPDRLYFSEGGSFWGDFFRQFGN